MCSTSLSFFASEQTYIKLLHTLTILELSTHSFGAYIIITKTPKKLESVKASMLYLQFVGAFVDVYFSWLAMPILVLPLCAGHAIGLLSFFGVPSSLQVYVGFCSLAVMVMTVVIFLEDRRYRLVNGQKSNKMRKLYRLLFVTANYVYATLYPAPIYFLLPDQEYGRILSKSKNPCIPNEYLNHPNFFLLDLDGKYTSICILLMLSSLVSQMFWQIGLIFRQMLKNPSVSQNTHRLQYQFLIAMSLQGTIPMIIIVFPAFFYVVSIMLNYHNQGANNLSFLIISMHGVLSTLTMLMAHRPYRQSIVKMLNLNFNKAGGGVQRIWTLSRRNN
ncbi:Serpentine Receptor, class H [Caenorhabditis elegans]|uniref:Serpentine Receptor, class H n=1 Tax=Caenorhabditis elegans TaxID=6239 RepID=Q9XV76_CAEEL|nr:Serpentine Receptor, class H [Caenorhabditis elegans]CAB04149.1 Serpentine Receptor, class H [Caenorhabditis elegans]|eukprot:NP_507412.1 Serpentine Receptor, class H [Caenorhabditis elegans]